jgi:hypothetical protein
MSTRAPCVGAVRWRIVVTATGDPPACVAGKTSYPSERVARAFCAPGEAPQRVRVVARTGPWHEALEPYPETP